ncbi:MAG: DUF11 domain-containing protein [Alphaproteobacteria bacterium]|nr:DUF11 domain-containing protein [Alphaproteobacteria bacterium]
MRTSLALLALVAPAAALAQTPGAVQLVSSIKVEHVRKGPDGKPQRVVEEAKKVVPGDGLIFSFAYRNAGAKPATGFVITDPLPANVAFAGGETPGALYSVDRGKSWGPLASLRVPTANGGSRAATSADVNGIRWAFPAIPPGGSGQVSFRGLVK